MKALGAEIMQFWVEWDGWKKFYVDDIDGELPEGESGDLELDPLEKYDLDRFGYLVPHAGTSECGMTFESAFRGWKRSVTTATIVVQCQKDKAEELTAAIIAAGGKITRGAR